MQYIILIVLAQPLYSSGDLVRKAILHGRDFDLTLLRSIPFWLTMTLSMVAFVIQLYVMKHYDLSRTIVVLGCSAIVFSAILGAFFFKERMNAYDIIGVGFAIMAVIFMNIKD
jgi:drug/metabolite transporter (DMT)-like permease